MVHGLCTITRGSCLAIYEIWLHPFYPGTSRGRPILVDQYTYGEAVRSVAKRQVKVEGIREAEGPRSNTFPLYK